MKVTIGYVNPPREGKTNGSLRLTDGSYLSCPPNLLPLFEGTENTTVDIATRQFKGSSGDMVTMVDSGPGGMRAPAPPRAAQSSVPPKPQGGPVGVSQQGGLQPDRRLAELEKFFEMYITGSVGRHLGGGGKATSEHIVMATEAVRVFEQVIGPAFLRLSNLFSAPPLPKVITPPIETWTNNTRTTPNSEPGDPGPVELQ
jgi:hypothetical protein